MLFLGCLLNGIGLPRRGWGEGMDALREMLQQFLLRKGIGFPRQDYARELRDVKREIQAFEEHVATPHGTDFSHAAALYGLAHARVKLGFDRRRARDAQWLFTSARIPARAPQHVQDQYFEFLEWLGVDPQPVTWGLTVTPAEREAQAAFFRALDAPACAVVVATSRAEKNW